MSNIRAAELKFDVARLRLYDRSFDPRRDASLVPLELDMAIFPRKLFGNQESRSNESADRET